MTDEKNRPEDAEGSPLRGEGPGRLWAPWRIAYFTDPQPEECIFCTLPSRGPEADEETLILGRFDHCFVIMNRYPYNNGHLMVVPFQHTSGILDLSREERAELLEVAGICTRALEEGLDAQGYNIGFNLGRAAGAGIAAHIHLHVVPRWKGDTNFMPVLGDVKVLSESLEDTWKRLRPAFEAASENRE
ncbi:MAG: HIT domain-containing protein [bacterium]